MCEPPETNDGDPRRSRSAGWRVGLVVAVAFAAGVLVTGGISALLLKADAAEIEGAAEDGLVDFVESPQLREILLDMLQGQETFDRVADDLTERQGRDLRTAVLLSLALAVAAGLGTALVSRVRSRS